MQRYPQSSAAWLLGVYWLLQKSSWLQAESQYDTLKAELQHIIGATIPHLNNNFKYSFSSVDEMSKLDAWFCISQQAATENTYLFSLFLPSNSCRVLAFALLTKRCFTWSSVRHIMTRRYGTVPCHLLVPASANSVASSWSWSKMLCSISTSAKRNELQSPSQTGLSCNHFIILGLF